ncbi:MAG: protein translocase subunit SecF, partial [Nitrospiraceae bacterium]|nr:protein translocase subunit SecF [Nitrospiraceae bacterium]
MFELIRNPSIDFMGKKKISLAISSILVLVGLLALFQIIRGKANLGIDFTGGTALMVHFDHPESLANVRQVLSKKGFTGAQIQNVNNTSDLFIRVKVRQEETRSVTESLLALLRQSFPNNPMTIRQSIEIGPTIGSELAGKALVAILFSLVGFIVYIAVRFEFRFGLAAAISTFHNVIAVLGILYLLGTEINLLIVTSLLTLAGYSLTDTVVVFDR